MAIIQIPTPGYEGRLIHTYSDQNYKIKQIETGELYVSADDIIPCPYTYEETDILISSESLEDRRERHRAERNKRLQREA